MSGTPLRIALADDQAIVRAGLRALLERHGIVVALEADDGAQLLERLAQTPVDVVVSDIRMAGMDGIEALRRLRERGDATPVLLLTTFDESELLLRHFEHQHRPQIVIPVVGVVDPDLVVVLALAAGEHHR